MSVRYKTPHKRDEDTLHACQNEMNCSAGNLSLYQIMLEDFLKSSSELAGQLQAEVAMEDLAEACHVAQLLKNYARLAGEGRVSELCTELIKFCSADATETVSKLSVQIAQACREANRKKASQVTDHNAQE